MKARILYVDPSSRLVGLSLRSHLLPPGGVKLDNVTSERVGEVVQGCRMTAVHHHSGAVIELPDGSPAFAHVSKRQAPLTCSHGYACACTWKKNFQNGMSSPFLLTNAEGTNIFGMLEFNSQRHNFQNLSSAFYQFFTSAV